jgi:hypothetical protein
MCHCSTVVPGTCVQDGMFRGIFRSQSPLAWLQSHNLTQAYRKRGICDAQVRPSTAQDVPLSLDSRSKVWSSAMLTSGHHLVSCVSQGPRMDDGPARADPFSVVPS